MVWLENVVEYLRQFLDLPAPRVPDPLENSDLRLTKNDVETLYTPASNDVNAYE